MTQEREKDTASRVIALFASARLTLVLLSAIAVLSFLGVTGWLGLGDVYHEKFFQLLLGLLFTNLLVCTVERLPAQVKKFSMDKGTEAPPPPREPDYVIQTKLKSAEQAISMAEELAFKKRGKLPRREITLKHGEKSGPSLVSFCSSGRMSLLGPPVTHLGILVILIGAIMGSMWPFSAFIYMRPGQKSDTALSMQNQAEVQLGFTISCNDFEIKYYDDTKAPADYICDLSILDQGREVARKVIEVNKPLYYKGFGIYQSSYKLEPLIRLTARNVEQGDTVSKTLMLEEPWTLAGTSVTFVAMDFEKEAVGMGRRLGPKLTVWRFINDKFGGEIKLFEMFPDFDKSREGEYTLSFTTKESRLKTGLKIIKDPGVPVVWAGFAVLVLGAMQSLFIYHRRVWLVAREVEAGVELGLVGRTKKARGMFNARLRQMAEKLKDGLGA